MGKTTTEQTEKQSRSSKKPQSRKLSLPEKPTLRFSPTAWAKLLFFRDHGLTEVGGFGITAADDLLYVEDFATVAQEVSGVSVSFDDEAVADFFDAQVDAGRKPEQFARVWLHTHPGNSPEPSGTDEETFQRVFGRCQWAVLFVLARGGKSYAKLRFNVGPGGHVLIPVSVDYSQPFAPSDHKAWEAEFEANIKAEAEHYGRPFGAVGYEAALYDYVVPEDWVAELEAMDPDDRQFIMDELAGRQDLWEGDEDES